MYDLYPYEVVAGNIIEIHFNGHALPPLEKEIPSAWPIIPISVIANTTTDYYIRAHYPREILWPDCYSFRLEDT